MGLSSYGIFHHIPTAVVTGLRRRLVEVLSCQEAGMLSVPDEAHLELAALTKEKLPTRKADLAAVIMRYLDRERLRPVWQGLD